MVKMIMHGCCGAMGHVITGLAAEDGEIRIVAGIDVQEGTDLGYPVFPSLDQCSVEADVIVDFASPKAVDGLLAYSCREQVPVVLCTTGLSGSSLRQWKRPGQVTAILRSANMSLGVNLLLKLVVTRPGYWQDPVLTWKSWKSTTTRKWTRPAAQPWPWQIP